MPDDDDDNFIILDDEDEIEEDGSLATQFGTKTVSGQLRVQMEALVGLTEEERGLVWKDAVQEFAAVAGALIFSSPDFEPLVSHKHIVEVVLEVVDDENDEPPYQLH